MSPPEVEVSGLHYDTIDINIVPDLYVTWIVDIWEGERDDITTEIVRFIGVWPADALEDEEGNGLDPTFSGRLSDYGYRHERVIKPKPMHWKKLEVVKQPDREALRFKDEVEAYSTPSSTGGVYRYGHDRVRAEKFQGFLSALDVLGADPSNEEAWNTVEAWRTYDAHRNEK